MEAENVGRRPVGGEGLEDVHGRARRRHAHLRVRGRSREILHSTTLADRQEACQRADVGLERQRTLSPERTRSGIGSGPALDGRGDTHREYECQSACYHARVPRTLGRVLSVVLLLALSVLIGDLAPDLASLSHHHDGDWDDAGHVGRLHAHGINAAVTDTRPALTPLEPTRRTVRPDSPRPPQVAREPLGSRAPPA